jgi:hypothetical protein
MTNELIVTESSPYAIMPVLEIKTAMARRQAVIDFTGQMMVAGRDFGKIPGTGKDAKPTLLKPGAEKLASLFGLSPLFEIVERDLDWTGDRHSGEPFFYIQYRCTLTRGDLVAGQGLGSCNSWEKKYRYRQGERVCPECGKAAIIQGKEEYGGGWVCFKKKDGCGYKFQASDPRIIGQQVGQVKNTDPADVVNTIDKMAQKRALVAAVLIAVNASEMFTQDIEDYSDIIDGDYQVEEKPRPAPAKPTTNGKPAAPQPEPAGPLPDDELIISEATAKDFLTAAAAALDTDTDDVKARLHQLGYNSIPGDRAKRLDAYRRMRDAQPDPAQAAIIQTEPEVTPGAEYQE